ncbi:MAG: mechanosensitive ion channel family protein [Thermodesulfobacteriota bacterium]
MNEILTQETILTWVTEGWQWLVERVFAPAMLVQVVVILAALAVGSLLGRPVRRYLEGRIEGRLKSGTRLDRLVRRAVQLVPVGAVIVLIWIASLVMRQVGGEAFFLGIVQTLLVAWLTIRLFSSVLLDRSWSRFIAITAWVLAALHIVGALGPALAFLDGLGFSIGKVHLTVLSLFKAAIVLLALLRIGSWLGETAERKLGTVSGLTPSTTVLLSKIIKITLFTVIFLVALNSVGIDFTALAVFSGAVGVGVGFGLQKVVGNFVSGVILLLDKSIKPGDVIQMGDVYGWISNLRGRYVSVVTRDGKEFLIPNEDLITQQVINWSFSNRKIRLKVPIGISYEADPHQAMELVVGAARGMARVLDDPAPVCRLVGFGDNSVDLELRFWIEDPQNGTMNVQSKILLEVWDRFKEHGIGIPFPQRDVHLDVSDANELARVVAARPDRA